MLLGRDLRVLGTQSMSPLLLLQTPSSQKENLGRRELLRCAQGHSASGGQAALGVDQNVTPKLDLSPFDPHILAGTLFPTLLRPSFPPSHLGGWVEAAGTYSIIICDTTSKEVKPASAKLSLYWPILMASSHSSTVLKLV